MKKMNKPGKDYNIKRYFLFSMYLVMAFMVGYTLKVSAVNKGLGQVTPVPESNLSPEAHVGSGVLHAFYPAYAVLDDQIKNYIAQVDSLSLAWSKIDAKEPGVLNTVRGKNNNYGFYYPKDYLQVVEYAKSLGKPIQLSVYMDGSDCIQTLPYPEKRASMIEAIIKSVKTDITQEKGIYYDGVVIDFEGLRNTDSSKNPLLYKGKPISTYFISFLSELKEKLLPLSKNMYVAVNPSMYYDGYAYADIIDVADRVIVMAHDYEPTAKLTKKQVQQYTNYNALKPVSSLAPIQSIRLALHDMYEAASDEEELSKVWLQISFDSAQWQFDVPNAAAWNNLADTALSRKGRIAPLYKAIKARVDNTDGKAKNLTYGYNNELQSPYLQFFNTSDKSWNVIIYEDSNSVRAKIELTKAYGLGGISIWSLNNIPNYTDSKGVKYHLDVWTTILEQMSTYGERKPEYSEKVTIEDAALEQSIRNKLGKTSGDITTFDLKSIYRLKLSQGVMSLTDLKYLTNLEYLDASQLELYDISPIADLKNLHVLYLQRNAITDLSALKKLANLEVLSLNGNQITDISALSGLKKLKELYIRENMISQITALAKLTNLEILELGANSISKIDSVQNMKKLRQLALDNNNITNISALEGLTSLESLYLQRNKITNISSLSGLKNLKLLSLNGNSISNLKPLAKLTTLEKLYLKENKITKVTYLKNLTNLKELSLGGNNITDYTPLSKIYRKEGFICDFKL